ncbi:hypothetical protein ACA910_021043 [Epithemia clementina (nom. ined.)]
MEQLNDKEVPRPSQPSRPTTTATTKTNNATEKKRNILLGVAGSVAAVKAPEIAVCLCRDHPNINNNNNISIKILLTAGARNFWEQSRQYNEYWWAEMQKELDVSSSPRIQVLHSEDEWRSWNELGDPIMHIDLRDWADCLVIAPLSAHTLAKLAHGLCDDALSSVARAWDFGKPMVLAPAMNTNMWEHPLTQQQLETIQSFFRLVEPLDDAREGVATTSTSTNKIKAKCHIVPPQVKPLACGQVGNGALAQVPDIVEAVTNALALDK